MTDLILAILHHLLVFGLVAMLVAESMLVRPGMRAMDVDRVVRIDVGYGATAILIIVVGLLRVFTRRGFTTPASVSRTLDMPVLAVAPAKAA